MTLLLIRILSFAMSCLPEFAHRLLTGAVSDLVYYCLPERRRIVLSNLDHAFPDRSAAWKKQTGRLSFRQMIETGLISLILPYLSPARIRRMLALDAGTANQLRQLFNDPRPIVFVTPHLGGWELGTCMRLLVPEASRELGCIYRPLDHPQLNAWVVKARSRFGIQMMSRRSGLADGMRLLRGGGAFFILFDQTGPATSQLSVFLRRLCLSTPLPGLMVEKFNAHLVGYVMRRVSFFRYRIHAEVLDPPQGAERITRHLDDWLGGLLAHDEPACRTWLWAHNRWKLRESPGQHFRLDYKRSVLLGTESVPRTNRFYIRLPSELRSALWTLPLIRTLRASRPDASFTAVASTPVVELARTSGLFEATMTIPRAASPRKFARELYWRFPDYWLSLATPDELDGAARSSGCRHRFGIQPMGTQRRRLNHGWSPPPELDDAMQHRFRIVEAFFRHFGLEGEIDLGPVLAPPASSSPPRARSILCAAAPAHGHDVDRWPESSWQRLAESLSNLPELSELMTRHFTARSSSVRQLDASCSWDELVQTLRACRLVVTDDLNVLHLAGALGVPCAGLFGVINPVREGPLFRSPAWIIQPDGCSETGGTPLRALEPEIVLEHVQAAWEPTTAG